MKKSRIFAGISAIALAVVGIAATNATSKFATYYYQEENDVCSIVDTNCSPGTANCTVQIGTTTYQVFTTRTSATTCATPAKKAS